jgi:carboxyl-terminal processing protease
MSNQSRFQSSRISSSRALLIPLLGAAIAALSACGGGGGGGGGTATAAPPPAAATAFPASASYAARCVDPRVGIDPTTGRRYTDVQGTLSDEKTWERSWIDELYLWYREVPNPDPTAYATAVDYFDVLKTGAVTASGKPKDRFHFVFPTADWIALSQSGVEAGYGASWAVIAKTPPRKVWVAFIEPSSPAALATIGRGAQVLAVDEVDLVNGSDVDKINAGLYPTASGQTHTFSILDVGASSPRAVTLVSANVSSTPVQQVSAIATTTGNVGYVLFNDHFATAEAELISAFNQLKAAAVTDLVLDIRYNGGGYLDIASELAYMIAGSSATGGRTFEKLSFNDKYPTTDPVTGKPLAPTPFHAVSLGFSAPLGQPLPFLGLNRVFVLTGADTCSASESIINSLRGIGVQVVQIGSTTCGKPYGFYPADNCGTTYFAIQFRGVNEQGFGDYADGFTPGGVGAANLPGCQVADDFAHSLGDPSESRLSAAMTYRTSQTCPAPTSMTTTAESARAIGGAALPTPKSPFRDNRILTR